MLENRMREMCLLMKMQIEATAKIYLTMAAIVLKSMQPQKGRQEQDDANIAQNVDARSSEPKASQKIQPT